MLQNTWIKELVILNQSFRAKSTISTCISANNGVCVWVSDNQNVIFNELFSATAIL